jgi:hypothetical protein
MEQYEAFGPAGNTTIIAAGASAVSATLVGGDLAGPIKYLVYNKGAADVWLGFGPTSDAAVANAAIPVIGSPRAALPCPAGVIQTFSLKGSLFFAAVAEVGLSSISVTPGYGA